MFVILKCFVYVAAEVLGLKLLQDVSLIDNVLYLFLAPHIGLDQALKCIERA